jgi:hypothetical protein
MKNIKKFKPGLLIAAVLSIVFIGCANDNNDNIDIDIPSLSSPANGAVINAEDLLFSWLDVTDASRYNLQVSTINDFSSTIVDEELTALSMEADIENFEEGNYFWRVRAGNENEWFDWSISWDFDVSLLVVLTGTIVEDMTLSNTYKYLLRSGVFVGNGIDQTVLRIEPGTTIYGESATVGMLVVNRNSQLIADGTAVNPIVFTSDKAVGSRGRGDWGGLIVNGKAPLNTGFEAFGEGGTGFYGGDDIHDNSGILRYLRIEFAGQELSPDNELNGIAFQGVGDGTIVDYVQVHMNKDDGIEFFGGSVNVRHAYVSGCADDQFDWTDGWQGKGQFWVCQQYGDDSDQGIEADNNGEENDASPRSMPTIYNITLVGDAGGAESDIGILLREGTAAVIKNAIVMNFGDCGLDLDHEATFLNGWDSGLSQLNGNLLLGNSIFSNSENWQSGEEDEVTFPFTTGEFLQTLDQNNFFADPLLVDALNKTNPNFSLANGSPALTGAAMVPNDGFFEAVDFIGAVGTVNWLEGWTTSATN